MGDRSLWPGFGLASSRRNPEEQRHDEERVLSISPDMVRNIVEGALLAAGEPVSFERLLTLFDADEGVGRSEMKAALDDLQASMDGRGLQLKEVGSGWRIQVREDLAPWISRLWEQRAPRYTRALLETLAVIAYQQPVTRSDIEHVRGVSVSSNIVKTLLERDWIRILGHRDVPGRPALYGTTRVFLDYFNLRALDELPPLAAIRDLDKINQEFGFDGGPDFGENEMQAETALGENGTQASADSPSDAAERPDLDAPATAAADSLPEEAAETCTQASAQETTQETAQETAQETQQELTQAPNQECSDQASEADHHEADDSEHPANAR